jgi:hypothetical protein
MAYDSWFNRNSGVHMAAAVTHHSSPLHQPVFAVLARQPHEQLPLAGVLGLGDRLATSNSTATVPAAINTRQCDNVGKSGPSALHRHMMAQHIALGSCIEQR